MTTVGNGVGVGVGVGVAVGVGVGSDSSPPQQANPDPNTITRRNITAGLAIFIAYLRCLALASILLKRRAVNTMG
ncbi:MAG: hypothetical protein RI591_03385 [Dehalococcoidia bacterium]|nr:hypothetical protein [Dehalococcoidia bacterium]